MPLMDPPRSHRYEVEASIGEGGVGEVFRAYDPQLHRHVALKRLHVEGSAEETYAKALREAMHLASLQHPHIVSVYDVGEDERGPFVVMELVHGETLEEVVERGAFPMEDFLLLARQSLDALAAAHHIGLLHRDLKPGNMMLKWGLTSTFEVKVLDFGLAKFAPRAEAERVGGAFDGSVFGSIHFMAPEQFERGPTDARTDLYSLGCLFYYALTGAYPFEGELVGEVMENHLQGRVEPLNPCRPDLSPALCAWVMGLIARRPEDRPESALRALADLQGLTAAAATRPMPPSGFPRPVARIPLPTPALPRSSLPPTPTPTPPVRVEESPAPARHVRWANLLVLLGIAGLAAAAGAFWWQSRQAAPPGPDGGMSPSGSLLTPRAEGTVFAATDLGALRAHVGETVTVEGRIVSRGTDDQRTVFTLNFAARSTEAVSLVCFANAMPHGLANEAMLQAYIGKRVRARGQLSESQGALQMVVRDVAQIEAAY